MRSPASPRVLIVDDDLRLRTLLERYLEKEGCTVETVSDAKQMDGALAQGSYDLIVLDLMLPDEDGLSICKRLRVHGDDIPILMLTAKGDEIERIIGLELGADDYVAKPVNPRELLARIRAILRRQTRYVPAGPGEAQQTESFGACELNLATRQLLRDGKEISLTSGEFSVLKALVNHPRRPLSREQLMNLARGRDHGAFDRSIDVQISRLRRMVEPDPSKPRYIQTVWGVGYVFVPDEEIP